MHSRSSNITKLSRTSAQRTALIRSLARSFIMDEGITTTKPKAKAVRPFVERLVTKAKKDDVPTRRLLRSRLNNLEAVTKLVAEIGPRYQDRPGGYTRIVPAGFRRGDNAEMVRLEWVASDTKPAIKEDK